MKRLTMLPGVMTWSGVAKVRLLGWLLGLVALVLLDLVLVRENRLLPGNGLNLWQALVQPWPPVLLVLWGLAGGCLSQRAWPLWAALAAVLLFVPLLLSATGQGAALLLTDAPRGARVSLGAGLWTMLFAVFVLASDLFRDARIRVFWRNGLLLAAGLWTIWVFASGGLDQLSLIVELSHRQDRFFQEMTNHLGITALSVSASGLIGIPLGFAVSCFPGSRSKVLPVLNVIQTIPSLALFGLLIAPLALMVRYLPVLERLGIQGIGWAPAVIALTLYALLPIVHNTYAGFDSVGSNAVEAGRGMGMSRLQLLRLVELPLALPVVLNGLRIASVQNIGNTAVAALIGAGGFGAFIFQGMGQAASDLILLGALPTIGLAVAADRVWQSLIDLTLAGGSQ